MELRGWTAEGIKTTQNKTVEDVARRNREHIDIETMDRRLFTLSLYVLRDPLSLVKELVYGASRSLILSKHLREMCYHLK